MTAGSARRQRFCLFVWPLRASGLIAASRATLHGRSMEAEARTILAQSLNNTAGEHNLGFAIHRRFEALEADSLQIPRRQPVRNPPELGE